MYLVDTNVWLERLLDQEQSQEVGFFLNAVNSSDLFMTDFCLHSIGVIMIRLAKEGVFEQFFSDTMEDAGVGLIRLDAADIRRVLDTHRRHGLDFDDAYQYVGAEKYDLTIVSLDSDFDRTDRGWKTPLQLLQLHTSG